jgi:hypothetical protein
VSALVARQGEGSRGVGRGMAGYGGRGGDVRAAVGQWRKAVRPTGVCGHDVWHRPRSWRTSLLPCNSAPGTGLGPAVSSAPRRARAYGGDGGRRGVPVRDVAAWARPQFENRSE